MTRFFSHLSLSLVFCSSLVMVTPGCRFASRQRVQSISRMNDGIQADSRGDTDEAIKALEDAIRIDPTHAAAHFTLGQLHFKESHLEKAEDSYRQAIELSVRDSVEAESVASYWYDTGLVVMMRGDMATSDAERQAKYTDAIEAFERCIKLKPSYYQAHFRKGVLLERLDQPKLADAAFRETIEYKPTYSPAYVALGNMYIDYGHAEAGKDVMKEGIRINNTDARMWNGRGRAELALNLPQQAVESLKHAHDLDPTFTDVLFGLGMAYAELRQRDEAVKYLKDFLNRAGSGAPEDIRRAATTTIDRMSGRI